MWTSQDIPVFLYTRAINWILNHAYMNYSVNSQWNSFLPVNIKENSWIVWALAAPYEETNVTRASIWVTLRTTTTAAEFCWKYRRWRWRWRSTVNRWLDFPSLCGVDMFLREVCWQSVQQGTSQREETPRRTRAGTPEYRQNWNNDQRFSQSIRDACFPRPNLKMWNHLKKIKLRNYH